MKMTKKKVSVAALAVCLIAILSVGSLAWFTDADSVKNNFYIACSDDNEPDEIFSVDVYECNPEGAYMGTYVAGINYDDILPGDALDKNAYVKNTGHYDQYIRVIITISDRNVWESLGYTFGNKNFGFLEGLFDGFDRDVWDMENSSVNSIDSVDDHNNQIHEAQYVLYYKNTLESKAKIHVFETFNVPEDMTQEHASHFDDDGSWGFTISVKAQAVQTRNVGDSAYEAFETVGMGVDD